MSLTSKDTGGGDFELPPAGTHLAICYMLVDLGWQETTYPGKPVSLKPKVMIGWELPNEPMGDGRPFACSREYTNSLGEKANLRADLEAWRGQTFSEEQLAGFDLRAILGKPCLVTIVHKVSANKKTYANVKAVTSIVKGTVVPERKNELISYEIEAHDSAAWDRIPEWIQKKVLAAKEQPAPEKHDERTEEFVDDDIPF